MTVLITASSRHGSTSEIATAIAEELAAQEIACHNMRPEDVDEPGAYEAFVIGSAIYMGRWEASARAFVDTHREILSASPVWLFSTGPIGQDGRIGLDQRVRQELADACNPRDHRVFPGKLDRAALGRMERLIARVARAPEGDYRNWEEIRAWARVVAAAIVGREDKQE